MKKLGRHHTRVSVEAPVRKPKQVRGQMKAFSPADVTNIEQRLQENGSLVDIRDLALFRVAIDTMLRGSDVIALTVGTVQPRADAPLVEEFWWSQRKTARAVQCHLSERTRTALGAWLAAFWDAYTPNDRVFNISDRQFRNRIKLLAGYAGHDPRLYSGHSTRRTLPKQIYAQERNLAAARLLLGHTSIGATAEYLGVEREDAKEAWKRNVL